MSKTSKIQRITKKAQKANEKGPKIKKKASAISKITKAATKATIKDQWERELKKAKERASRLPEGWDVNFPEAPKTKKQLEAKVKQLQKVSIKNLPYGKLPKWVTYSAEQEFKGSKFKSMPITSQKYRELYRLKKADVMREGQELKFEDFKPKFFFTSKEGLSRYEKGLKRRTKKSYMSQKNEIFKKNFLKSLDIIQRQTYGSSTSTKGEHKKNLQDISLLTLDISLTIENMPADRVVKEIEKVLGTDETLLYNKFFGSSQYMIGEFEKEKLRKIRDNIVPPELRLD